MQKVALYGHGGSGNHGCEAIVRGLVKWLALRKEDMLLSKRIDEDIKYGISNILTIVDATDSFRPNIPYKINALLTRNSDKYYYQKLYRYFPNKIKECDVALSIGGDNYCYPGLALEMSVMRQMAAKAGAKTVLMGCSVDLSFLDKQTVEDMRQYDRIICRETMTYEAFQQVGFKNLEFAPDPAFGISRTLHPLPPGFIDNDTVGINISPLIIREGVEPEVVLRNYATLIKFILENTSMNIALIPHVIWGSNNDQEPMRYLYDLFPEQDRIVMIEDQDAASLKGFISRCRFMVAARTHASIAAYSTGVPTLVVGYSIKSLGIARDLFGSNKGFVIPVKEMKQDRDLTNAFLWIMHNENQIRNRYDCFLTEYLKPLDHCLL